MTEATLKPILLELVHVLENSVGLGEKSPFFDLLVTNHPLKRNEEIPLVTFSGGVADCFVAEEKEPFKFGDIGFAIRKISPPVADFSEKKCFKAMKRFVQLWLAQAPHTAEISGSTIAYREQILPIKNIPILKLAKEDEELAASELSERIREKLNWHTTEGTPQVALAIRGIKIRLLTTFSDMEKESWQVWTV